MSFSFQSSPLELNLALNYAKLNGVIGVGAAGSDGKQSMVYPAGYSGTVMGVASTSNNDALSTFSNYGPNLVWVGAPGEGVVTFYPYGTYAATWGTSFSTPFVAGAAALLLDDAVSLPASRKPPRRWRMPGTSTATSVTGDWICTRRCRRGGRPRALL